MERPDGVLLLLTGLAALATCAVVILAISWRRFARKYEGKQLGKVMVVLGSGGHTSEMLALVEGLDASRFMHVTWVFAETDITSLPKLQRETKSAKSGLLLSSSQSFEYIPRSREVGQSWISSLFTSAIAFKSAIRLIFSEKPALVLTNGPGTCVPVVISAILFRIFHGRGAPRLVYVESFCRVKSLSLTGRLLYYLVDQFIVQWPQLADRYPRAKYLGTIF